ncbi:MAG: protein-glutamate O-methyltransferase CheR [Epsilonproteobacteria bacterium]|nr:protein-glutamate O-methyltransferase CheR [Campylobacterota bacterium]
MQKIELLTLNDFTSFQDLILKETGIKLSNTKRTLLQTKILERMKIKKIKTFKEYYHYILKHPDEKAYVINFATTNETYFFREKRHLEFFKKHVALELPKIRLWSAAASVGAEAYTLAMILKELGRQFEIIGTDINHEVIHKARQGVYPITWAKNIPDEYLKKYCLRGKNDYKGWFMIGNAIKKNVKFKVANLLYPQKDLGLFDVIFLKNVLIYFDDKTKKKVVENVLHNLKTDGYLFISLTENIDHLKIDRLHKVDSSVYQLKDN